MTPQDALVTTLCSIGLLSSCTTDERADKAQTITAEDFRSLGPDEILRVDLNDGVLEVDNTHGLIDFNRVELLYADGDYHPASEAISRKFGDNGHVNHLLFSQGVNGPETDYLFTNFNYTVANSPTNSTWWKSPVAYCTNGSYLLGMGAEAGNSSFILFRGMLIGASSGVPYSNESAYQEDVTGVPSLWYVRAYATCASASGIGLTLHYADSVYNSTSSKSATVSCPSGKQILGAGGTIAFADQVVKIDGIVPSGVSGGTGSATVYASEYHGGTSSNWKVRAYAVCAIQPAGWELIHVVAGSGQSAVQATCSSTSKRLLSVGGWTEGASGLTGLGDIIPLTAGRPMGGYASTAVYGAGPAYTLHGYAICANP